MSGPYINTARIQAAVTLVENRKRFKRDAGLIMRHIVEEVGELSAALYRYEASGIIGGSKRTEVGRELIDLISLSVYMADVLGINLNALYPQRMSEVFAQYKVREVVP